MRLLLFVLLLVATTAGAQGVTLPGAKPPQPAPQYTVIYVTYKIKTNWGGIVDVGMIPIQTKALKPGAKPNTMLDELLIALRSTGKLDNIDLLNPGRASVTIVGWTYPVDGAAQYSTDPDEIVKVPSDLPEKEVPGKKN